METYWILSGPAVCNRICSCRACHGTIAKRSQVMVRDGRKLRLFYHVNCFTGSADPRTQVGSSFEIVKYHQTSAPKLSSLEGSRAYIDQDGRQLGRSVFKSTAPSTVGHGKWSVNERGYKPK